jgi:beta-lactamase class D
MITNKTEQLIEEVEKLEIAFESWSSDGDISQFGEDFKSEFDQVLNKSSASEVRKTYMRRQEYGVEKVEVFFSRLEVPLLL